MLVKEIVPTEQVVDILCDVCGRSTKTNFGTNQYGSLSADFGYGSRHDGERYLVHLCEMCFFGTLATMREMHRGEHMFDDDYEAANPDTFGRDYSNREII
ncbi:hypothetical protein GVO02_20150 [Aeromonas caviae]|jgi:hypothetical protein|uniref:Uncharacterized protein n=3 Tax=Aeromonas caviae TaxID=648 RepID=A0A7T4C373_AERCA|nr:MULTISPECIES: hypothetical protein [Aeromonas]HEH9428864.1 hypothetical protein [Aeromonas sobria]AXV20832.1 hypothetical protein C7U63_13150 [Aeromonas veronii]MBL0455579.1 hypothetical protein [Aeromonas veronii]MBL0478838.1 hypothetical protein [Aeromonas veronii]MBL0559205.1 hypothetical protein [Aeromonas caviae]